MMSEKELIKRVLLQFATAVTKCVSFMIKCDSYYKLQYLSQNMSVHTEKSLVLNIGF